MKRLFNRINVKSAEEFAGKAFKFTAIWTVRGVIGLVIALQLSVYSQYDKMAYDAGQMLIEWSGIAVERVQAQTSEMGL